MILWDIKKRRIKGKVKGNGNGRTSMAMPRLVLDPTASVKTRIANRRRHGGLEAEWGADGKGAAPQVLEHKLVAMLIGLRSIEDGEYDHLWQLQGVVCMEN